MHRGEDLHVAARVEPELARDPGARDVHGEAGGRLGVVAREQEEVRHPVEQGRAALVDPVRVGDDAALRGLAEDLGEADARDHVRGEQVAQHLAGADARQLVDVTDQEQVRTRRDGFDQLVRQDQVEHRGLVDDQQVRLERVVAVVGGVAAGLELEQAVDRGGGVAGQLGEAFRGPAGRRDELDLGALGRCQLDDRADGEALSAAGAAGQHRDLLGERQLDGLLLLGGEGGAGAFVEPVEGLGPVDVVEARHPVRFVPQ